MHKLKNTLKFKPTQCRISLYKKTTYLTIHNFQNNYLKKALLLKERKKGLLLRESKKALLLRERKKALLLRERKILIIINAPYDFLNYFF